MFLTALYYYLNLQLCIFDPQLCCVLSSLSFLVKVQLSVQQLSLCLKRLTCIVNDKANVYDLNLITIPRISKWNYNILYQHDKQEKNMLAEL